MMGPRATLSSPHKGPRMKSRKKLLPGEEVQKGKRRSRPKVRKIEREYRQS